MARNRKEFKEEYESRKAEIVDEATGYLQVKLNEATATVIELMNNKEILPQTRLNAARTVFEFCYKLYRAKKN